MMNSEKPETTPQSNSTERTLLACLVVLMLVGVAVVFAQWYTCLGLRLGE